MLFSEGIMDGTTGINLLFHIQHSVQLQEDYEDTKAEMPWLQLEEENLDEVKSSPPAAVKAKKPEIEQPTTTVREGRDGGVGERTWEREEKGGRGGEEWESEGGT